MRRVNPPFRLNTLVVKGRSYADQEVEIGYIATNAVTVSYSDMETGEEIAQLPLPVAGEFGNLAIRCPAETDLTFFSEGATFWRLDEEPPKEGLPDQLTFGEPLPPLEYEEEDELTRRVRALESELRGYKENELTPIPPEEQVADADEESEQEEFQRAYNPETDDEDDDEEAEAEEESSSPGEQVGSSDEARRVLKEALAALDARYGKPAEEVEGERESEIAEETRPEVSEDPSEEEEETPHSP